MSQKRCIIVGGGDLDPALLPEKRAGDLLIAADSGFAAFEKAGLLPDICVGDFDSLGYEPEGCETLRLPVEKDDTDMVAAARLAMERGYDRLCFLGVLGGSRFSHSVAALQTLGWLAGQGIAAEIIDSACRVTALKGTGEWPTSARGSVSVFALGGPAVVSIEGLKYDLCRHELGIFPLGVSNSFVGLPARISVHEGVVLVVEEPDEGPN